eukprot:3037894-Prorocentrum_lima.AAC.1
MTSSLVGSEMCIRDRLFIACFRTMTSMPVRLSSKFWTCSFCDASYTVSYTHLTLPTICSV